MKAIEDEVSWTGEPFTAAGIDAWTDGRGIINGRTAKNGLTGYSRPTQDEEQISPELILVSPPDVQERARALLPPVTFMDEESRARFWANGPRSGALADQPPDLTAASSGPAMPAPVSRAGIHPVLVAFAVALTAAAGAAGGFAVGRAGRTNTPTQAAGRVPTALQNDPLATAVSAAGQPGRRVVTSPHPTQTATAKLPSRPVPTVTPVVKEPSGRLKAPSGGDVPLPAADPAKPAPRAFVPSRVFAWPAAPRATFYVVRFFRDGRKILEQRTTKARFTIPSTFHFTPGSYRWYVTAAFGSVAKPRLGTPIVDSSFDVSQAATSSTGP